MPRRLSRTRQPSVSDHAVLFFHDQAVVETREMTTETGEVIRIVVPTSEVVRTCWLEDTLGEGWVAAYRVVPRGGRPIFAEARVFPGVPGHSDTPGGWSGEPGLIPGWGLTARRLKNLTPDTSLRSIPDFFGQIKRAFGEEAFFSETGIMKRHGFSPATPQPLRRVGRPAAYDDLYYALKARDYLRVCRTHRDKQLKRLADQLRTPEPTVRTWLQTARSRGLLTDAPPGQAGGQLTAEARALLEEAGEETE